MTLDLMHGDEHPILIVELQPTFDRVKAMDTWLAFAQQLAPTAKIHVAPAANGTFEVFAPADEKPTPEFIATVRAALESQSWIWIVTNAG